MRGRNPGDNPETEGRVVAVHGRHYRVESALGRHDCVTRGKKGGLACGDRIRFRPTGADTGVIEASLPRANLLYRSDAFRAKLLAANLDQVFVVTAARPTPNLALLDRCLVAAEAAGIAAHIVLNKADLVEASTTLATQLQAYAGLGYDLLSLSAKADVTPLAERLAGRTSILVGASGVGKSTLVNALVPEAEIVTQAISEVLDSGKHTTTHTRLYHLPNGGALIDSPGMQEFGLRHLSTTDLQRAFPEFRGLESGCRFYNCQHLREPGCAVLAALEHGDILPARWQTYRMLIEENAPTPY